MSLTKEDDQFVPISALASRYWAATGDQYQVWKQISLGNQSSTIVQKSFLSSRLFGLSGTLLQPGHGHLYADQ